MLRFLAPLAVVLAAGTLFSSCCPTTQATAQTPSWRTPAVTQAEPIPVVRLALLESRPDGFAYCCGNDSYKMAMHCDERIKRCYHSTAGGWEQTYGRHCKRILGATCYLQTCERMCSAGEP